MTLRLLIRRTHALREKLLPRGAWEKHLVGFFLARKWPRPAVLGNEKYKDRVGLNGEAQPSKPNRRGSVAQRSARPAKNVRWKCWISSEPLASLSVMTYLTVDAVTPRSRTRGHYSRRCFSGGQGRPFISNRSRVLTPGSQMDREYDILETTHRAIRCTGDR